MRRHPRLSAREKMYDMRTLRWLESLGQDLVAGLRALARRPGTAAAVVLTLAVGIGATTAVFSLVHAVLLKPYADSGRLVVVSDPSWVDVGWGASLTGSQVEAYRGAASFEAVARVADAWDTRFDVMTPDGAERLRGSFVTPNFFELLGVRAALGRTFGTADEAVGERLVVLSDGLWQRRFGGDPGIIGSRIDVRRPLEEEGRYMVVGVLPPGFRFTWPLDIQLWVLDPWADSEPVPVHQMVARLRLGVSPVQAQAELAPLPHDALRRMAPVLQPDAGRTPIVETVGEHVTAGARPALLLLLGGAAVVMAIACVNVALILLAVAVDRRREIALRAVLGAGWWRIARPLLAEGALLASAAAAIGVWLAGLLLPVLRGLVPADMPRGNELSLDVATLAFTVALTIGTALVCGLAPAFHVRGWTLRGDLQRSGSTTTGDRRLVSWRRGAVIAQVSIVFALLVVASLLLHSVWRLHRVDPGFSADGVMALELHTKYVDSPPPADFHHTLLDRVRAVPGVAQASLATAVPIRGPGTAVSLSGCVVHGVDPQFFDLMRIPVRAGRLFVPADDRDSAPHFAVVSERCAARLPASTAGAIGNRLDLGLPTPAEVIGVVADVRYEGAREAPAPALYVPRAVLLRSAIFRLLVRPAPGAGDIAPAVLTAARSVDPQRPIEHLATIDGILREEIAQDRFQAASTAALGLIALLLALFGLAAGVARTVSERTREIAVRAALGAGPRQLVTRTVLQGMRPVGLGLAAGLVCAIGAARLLESWLFEISPLDPFTYAAAIIAFVCTAATACILPARRAARVELARSLRAE